MLLDLVEVTVKKFIRILDEEYDEEKTKELQKDWKGYGKSQVLFGIVVFVIFVLSALYYYIL